MLTIYKASAGSGKTYYLALQYVKYLLGVKMPGTERYVLNHPQYLGTMPFDGRTHRHILAITFTNKATAEMKNRIVKELDALARLPHEGADEHAGYAIPLIEEFGCTRGELAHTASRALQALLHDYNNFNVSTIDSFFQTVLRTFAREIDRQGDYRLELNGDMAIVAALTLMFDEVNHHLLPKGNPVWEWIRDFSAQRVEDGKDFNPFNRGATLFNELVGFVSKTFDERYVRHSQELSEYFSDLSNIKKFREEVKAKRDEHAFGSQKQRNLVNKAMDMLRAEGFDESKIGANPRAFFEKAVSAPDELDSKYFIRGDKTPKYIVAMMDGAVPDNFFVKGKKGSPQPSERVGKTFLESYTAMRRDYVPWKVYGQIFHSISVQQALAFIWRYINRFRRENNLVLLSDTNTLLNSIISKSEAPFIYERMGVELQHFLIDEFQDTSQLQWDNLKPLVDNSLADGHDNLIIGDVKQAIYRWRNADSTMLGHTVETKDFPGRNAVRGDKLDENTNYRSSHTIVRFNNTVFSHLASSGTVEVPGYQGLVQQLSSKQEGLTGRVGVTVSGSDASEAIEPMALRILEQHKAGYSWRDIAILVRTNKEAAAVVDYMLATHPEISVLSEEALLVRNSQAVKLVVSVLGLMDKTFTQFSGKSQSSVSEDTAPIINSYADMVMMMDRFEYFHANGDAPEIALHKALNPSVALGNCDGNGKVAEASEMIREEIDSLRRLAPSNLVALVEAILQQKVSTDLRKAELAYIAAFTDTVLDFTRRFNPSLHGFLEYWETVSPKLAISPGESQDAVSVLTIHKAKGLEWDCVHIPLLNWKLNGRSSQMWFTTDKLKGFTPGVVPALLQLTVNDALAADDSPFASQVAEDAAATKLDNLNVAYVAFTRAVRELDINLVTSGKGALSEFAEALLGVIASHGTDNQKEFMPLYKYFDAENQLFTTGLPTVPKHTGKSSEMRMIAAPDFNIEFNALTRRLTTLEDMTDPLAEAAGDPDIGTEAAVAESNTEMLGRMIDAARRGTRLHFILASMRSTDDVARAVAFAGAGNRFTPEEAREYTRVLSDAVAAGGELVKRWLEAPDESVAVEQPIYCPERDETFRPDRIIWYDDGSVDVVDYKFTTHALPVHGEQVARYVGLLRAMGYDDVRGYLWYPELAQIKKI